MFSGISYKTFLLRNKLVRLFRRQINKILSQWHHDTQQNNTQHNDIQA
jgi:hypothetical protein